MSSTLTNGAFINHVDMTGGGGSKKSKFMSTRFMNAGWILNAEGPEGTEGCGGSHFSVHFENFLNSQ